MKNSISILSVLIALAIVPSISCSAVSKTKPSPVLKPSAKPQSPTVPVIAKPKAKPGTVLWEWTSKDAKSIRGVSLGYDGFLYATVSSRDEPLVSINRITGKTEKVFNKVHEPYIGILPLVSNEGLVLPSLNKLVIVPPNLDGALAWEYPAVHRITGNASLGANKLVYFGGGGDKKVHAVDIKTGKSKWTFLGKNNFEVAPAICQQGDIYIGSKSGTFYALRGDTGDVKWTYTNEKILQIGGGSFEGAPNPPHEAIADERGWLYFTCYPKFRDTGVYALDAKNGDFKWFSGGFGQDISPAVLGTDETLYVNAGSSLTAINRNDGKVKWRTEVGHGLSSCVIGNDGMVYCSSGGRYIYAVDPKEGAIKWKVRTGDTIRQCHPLMDNAGILFAGSNDGRLYAIATSSTGPAKSPWPMYGQNAQRTHRAPASK